VGARAFCSPHLHLVILVLVPNLSTDLGECHS
jgi:hypothetical protein